MSHTLSALAFATSLRSLTCNRRLDTTATASKGRIRTIMASSLAADEVVDIVDEHNQVLRQATRAEMRRDRLPHRSTYIFAKNSKGQFYVQKRTAIKDYCPGYFEVVAGGVVQAGETYKENAYREVEEELGIKGAPLTHLFTFYYEDERLRVFGDAWECTYDGELTLQPEEVESVHPMTMEEVFQRVEAGDRFTPDSLVAARKYLELKKQQQEVLSVSSSA